MGLGISIVLNTDDGTGTVDGLLIPATVVEAGCDLGIYAEVCERASCPRGAGFV